MSFFDKILVGLGFESTESDKPKKEKKQKKQKVITQPTNGVSFNFSKPEEPKEEIAKEDESSLNVENPSSQAEIQAIIERVKQGKTVILNVSAFNNTDRVRAMDFVSGAIYALRGRIQTLDNNIYVLYPQK